jgi:carbamoyltransferase
MLIAGLGGALRHGCVALANGGRLLGACAQERVTRVKGAGFNASGLPDEALDVLLERLGRSRTDVGRYVSAEDGPEIDKENVAERLDHHLAHACTAYLTSPFGKAVIVVCDEDAPKVSVWEGSARTIRRIDWPWSGAGFGDVYSRLGNAFGFRSDRRDHRLEALARLNPDSQDSRVAALVRMNGNSLTLLPNLEATIEEWARRVEPRGPIACASLAAAVQGRLGETFVEMLAAVRQQTGADRLCLGGSFFYHSWVNTLAKRSGIFDEVFVPVDPGNGGLAIGTALHASSALPASVSPFLGPAYAGQETKETLDNCKLHYGWESEQGATDAAVRALKQGTLVGWFDGAMEWGPRALGARCILANPFAPYVLENLNRFLKGRESWRGYAISGLEPAVGEHFEGPARSPFMEGDYRPRDPQRFANVLPSPCAAIRVQTVGDGALPRFRRLLEAFGAATGLPFLVNTSFNGFHEPIVCSPRDAVRVFYGSGVDLLVLDQFILRK